MYCLYFSWTALITQFMVFQLIEIIVHTGKFRRTSMPEYRTTVRYYLVACNLKCEQLSRWNHKFLNELQWLFNFVTFRSTFDQSMVADKWTNHFDLLKIMQNITNLHPTFWKPWRIISLYRRSHKKFSLPYLRQFEIILPSILKPSVE